MLSPVTAVVAPRISNIRLLTGLNLANFNDSLIVPYQQLVPNQNDPYSFNQIWMKKYGKNASTAVASVPAKHVSEEYQLQEVWLLLPVHLDSKIPLKHTGCIDRSPYVVTAEAYQSILDLLDRQQDSEVLAQFLQLVTMQNHMPMAITMTITSFQTPIFPDLSDGERWNINTYTKGVLDRPGNGGFP